MRNFKNLITELRWTGPGSTPSTPQRDPHEELKEIVSKLPYHHVTASGREIMRHNTHDFLDEILESDDMQNRGETFALEINSPHMARYFAAAQKTHEKLINDISAYIHDNVPDHLKNYVDPYIDRLMMRKSSNLNARERASELAGGAFGIRSGGFGKFEYERNHQPANEEGQHPHLDNEDRHLSRLV